MTAETAAGSPAMMRNGVGLRLLASFALLALLPMFAGVIGWTTSHAIHSPVRQIGEVTIAFGQYDRGYRKHSRILNAVYLQAMAFDSRARFLESRQIINDALVGMRGNIEGLSGIPGVAHGDEFLVMFDDAENTIRRTLDTAEQRIVASERERQLVADIGRVSQAIATAIAPAVAKVENSEFASDANEALLRRLNSLSYEAITLGVLAQDGEQSLASTWQPAAGSDFAEKLDAAIAELALLPQASLRQGLGELFGELRRLSVADGALFDTRQEVAALIAQEKVERNAARVKVLRIVDILGVMDATNEARSNELLTAADRALHKADLTFIGVGAACTLLALLVMLVFVKGNVLRRLHVLTSATQRLNNGQLEHPVPNEGNDELTALGSALESFRQNALALRRNEGVLQERTRSLEQLNRELDQFAYVASHDLKAPMRAIDSLAGFLREDLGKTLSDGSARHLDMMQGRIRRLEALLDSLLEYSRVGRRRSPCEIVNLRETIEAGIELVSPEDAQVRYSGDFGRVSTWKTPLEQIVRNLADNAFKHADKEQPVLSVDCEIVGRQVQIVMADDGPGIDPEFHERIFGMFQTLKPRDEVEGSGMGLAILKKLVDSYGGEIRVASNPATRRGASFIVRWPVEAVLPSIEGLTQREPAPAALAKAG